MTKSQQTIQMAAKLYDARDTARSIYGDKFKAKMDEYGDLIKLVMVDKKIDQIGAATLLCKATESPMQQITILAAAVEMVEPSEVEDV